MKNLVENGGIPRSALLMMAVIAGLTVANLYYNQPLLQMIRNDIGASEVEANLITVITQVGYACGLLFVIPAGDLYNRKHLVMVCMTVAALMLMLIGLSSSIHVIWGASFLLGVCSVVPQIFMPIAAQFSDPAHKSQNMGIILSGLLCGILASRVISGFVGEWIGWQDMFFFGAALMLLCLVTTLCLLPHTERNFTGSYPQLMHSVFRIFLTQPIIRFYSLRAALSFGSLLALWSCLAFHLAQAPFHAGSDKVGMLGLCGLVSAMATTGIGKYLPRYGYHKFTLIGSALQIAGWMVAAIGGDSYIGLIGAIVLVDVGVQYHQLSGQSGCIAQLPSASSRVSAIFMTIFFIGGSIGTFLAGLGWNHLMWKGVVGVGLLMAVASCLLTLLVERKKKGEE